MQTEKSIHNPTKIHGVYPSPRSLLTDQQQNELLYIRDVLTVSYFRIGDIANEAVLRNSTKAGVRAQDVYDEVGVWAGKSGRTVRYYAESAAFFPEQVRSEFDMVSFSHFDLARNYGERWYVVLDYARANPGITTDKVRRAADLFFGVRLSAYEEISAQDSDVRLNAYEDLRAVEGNVPILEQFSRAEAQKKPPASGSVAPLIGRLMSLIAELRLIAGEYKLSDELRSELISHEGALMSLIPRIISEIDGNGERD